MLCIHFPSAKHQVPSVACPFTLPPPVFPPILFFWISVSVKVKYRSAGAADGSDGEERARREVAPAGLPSSALIQHPGASFASGLSCPGVLAPFRGASCALGDAAGLLCALSHGLLHPAQLGGSCSIQGWLCLRVTEGLTGGHVRAHAALGPWPSDPRVAVPLGSGVAVPYAVMTAPAPAQSPCHGTWQAAPAGATLGPAGCLSCSRLTTFLCYWD